MDPGQLQFAAKSYFLISHFIPPAYEDGTGRVFRNVGIYNSDAGELPKRKQNTKVISWAEWESGT